MAGAGLLVSEIDALQGKLDFLSASNGVGKRMHALLRRLLQRVRFSAAAFPRFSLEDQQVHGPEILLSFMEVERAIDTIEGNRRVDDTRIPGLLRESILRILGPDRRLELLVMVSPRDEWSLYCDVEYQDDELAFILFLSPVVDYTSDDIVVRVVHEAAHTDLHIIALAKAQFGEPRRLGEVLCDMVALLISGPAFIYSTARLIQLRGAEKSRSFSESHPSMVCRATILESVAQKVWSSALLAKLTQQALYSAGDLNCLPEEVSELKRLSHEALRSISRYIPIATPESTWEQVYSDPKPDEQSSILLLLNASLARQGLGR